MLRGSSVAMWNSLNLFPTIYIQKTYANSRKHLHVKSTISLPRVIASMRKTCNLRRAVRLSVIRSRSWISLLGLRASSSRFMIWLNWCRNTGARTSLACIWFFVVILVQARPRSRVSLRRYSTMLVSRAERGRSLRLIAKGWWACMLATRR